MESLRKRRKIHLLLGARQAGKTTLLKSIIGKVGGGAETVYLNCDVDEDRSRIDTTSLTRLTALLIGKSFLFLDEAQRLTNPGLTLKIIYDELPAIKVLATGSSSLDMKNRLAETLTGRYVDFILHPFSLREVILDVNGVDYLLPDFLLYGFYPEVYLQSDVKEKRVLLGKIAESYLFKDLLSFQRVRNSQAVRDLARALAYQLGAEVNENELASRLKIDRKTVVSYLDLLEKSFVIFRLYPFSKNPRREIGKNYKVYFVDLGIRNSLIDDFNEMMVRADLGALWENFVVLERRKRWANQGEVVEARFWRSYGGAEVDYLELAGGKIAAFEFKFGMGKLSKGAGSFFREYKSPVALINRETFLNFVYT